jgi:RimJ/RimL family protein N-acetyltransferase
VSDHHGSGSRLPDDRLVTAPGDLHAWNAQPVLLRRRDVTLREATRGDAFSLFSLLSQPQAASTIASGPKSPGALADLIETAAFARRSRRGMWLAVIPNGAGVVGLVRLREIEPGFKSAEWDAVLAHDYWGTGLFVHAASMAIDLVFDVLGATRLEARVAATNVRAQSAIRKLGACQEAVLRQSVQFTNGVLDDQVLLTMFAEDWHVRRDALRKIH